MKLVCDKFSDSSRDNSQSSTDTASFSGSTQGSCPPSVEKVKLEPTDVVENGMSFQILLNCLFCVHLHHSIPALLAFVVLGLVSSVPGQEIGWEERLHYDLFCVWWDVKPKHNE